MRTPYVMLVRLCRQNVWIVREIVHDVGTKYVVSMSVFTSCSKFTVKYYLVFVSSLICTFSCLLYFGLFYFLQCYQ